jgi:hypothetical protein
MGCASTPSLPLTGVSDVHRNWIFAAVPAGTMGDFQVRRPAAPPCARCMVRHDPRFDTCQHASSDASWHYAIWHRWPPIGQQSRLTATAQHASLERATVHVRSWAAPYYSDAPKLPAVEVSPAWRPLAAMLLAACQRLRRWSAYSDTGQRW